jgi:sugar/nucleoside kinase (ribokinase family)
MSVTVVGSVAFDALESPFGKRERVLGGAATHFSLAASFFTDVRVVGIVGDDFGDAEFDVFHRRGIDTSDIERGAGGESFVWSGRYDWDFDMAQTLDTQLNVFADFDPKLSEASRCAEVLFLANIQPELQRRVRDQCSRARFVGVDSMNYWIDTARDSLVETIAGVDAVLLNDAEIKMLTREPNLVRATRRIREWGPRVVVAKQGQYGAALFTEDGFFALPSYPLETVIDPTGAGDSFAGGFLGFLAAHAGSEVTDDLVRCAMAYGSVLASFNVEDFGTERVQRLTHDEIAERFAEFKRITHFEELPIPTLHAADSLSA